MRGKLGDKARLQHIFVHEYFGVDSTLVWEIIKCDLPDLKEKVREILETID